MDLWDWHSVELLCQMGLGWGACTHCGQVQAIDSFRWFQERFFCRKTVCDAQAWLWLDECRRTRIALVEQHRLEQERWQAATEEAERRLVEQDRLLQQHQTFACTRCSCVTDRLRLQQDHLLCSSCAGRQ